MSIPVNVPYSPTTQFIPELADKPYAPYFTDWCEAINYAVNQNYSSILTGLSDPTTTTGDTLYRGISGLTRLQIGASNQVLSVLAGIPAWQNISTLLGLSGTNGRMMYWNGSSITLLSPPTVGSVLTHSGVANTAPVWSASSSTGFVSGPASSIDNRIALFSLTTGKVIKMSGITVSAANALTGISSATLTAGLTATTGTFSSNISAVNGTFSGNISSLDHSFSGTSFSTGLSGSYQVLRGGSTFAVLTASGSSAPLGFGALRLNGPVGGVYAINRLNLSGNSDTANSGIPSSNTLYDRNILKAFITFTSAGFIGNQFNIASVIKTGTGLYTVSYKTPLSGSLHSVIPAIQEVSTATQIKVMSNGSAGFSLQTRNTAGTLVDSPISVIIAGVQ